LKSGNIYEFLALHAQAGEGNAAKKAAPYFEKALAAFKNPPDKIRIMLLTADALRRSGNNGNAVKMLEQIITTWPKLPETDAARELLKRWK
jgi:TolA-binding protein